MLLKECLRGKSNAPARSSLMTIAAGLTVEVYSLESGCLEVGKTRDLDVSRDNKNVTWSSFHESGNSMPISSTGLFKAPNQQGTYYIMATSAADASAVDTISVDVGNCECYLGFSDGGLSWTGDDTTFSKVVVPDYIVISRTGEMNLFSFQFTSKNLPAEGQTKLMQLNQGNKEWILTGAENLISVISPSEEEANGNSSPDSTGINLEITNNGHTLIGKITGSAVKLILVLSLKVLFKSN
jgi:hypothetical protein